MKLDMSCRDYMGIGWCLAFYCGGRLVDWVISLRYTMKLGRSQPFRYCFIQVLLHSGTASFRYCFIQVLLHSGTR
jgi:hypothetical protein